MTTMMYMLVMLIGSVVSIRKLQQPPGFAAATNDGEGAFNIENPFPTDSGFTQEDGNEEFVSGPGFGGATSNFLTGARVVARNDFVFRSGGETSVTAGIPGLTVGAGSTGVVVGVVDNTETGANTTAQGTTLESSLALVNSTTSQLIGVTSGQFALLNENPNPSESYFAGGSNSQASVITDDLQLNSNSTLTSSIFSQTQAIQSEQTGITGALTSTTGQAANCIGTSQSIFLGGSSTSQSACEVSNTISG